MSPRPPRDPQIDLFDHSSKPVSTQDLRIAPQRAAPLGKEQITFNRLIRQIEGLRDQLAAWAAFELRHQQQVIKELLPVQQQLVQARRDVIMLAGEVLAGRAAGGVDGKAEKKHLVDYLLELASVHVEDDPHDAEVIAVHDQYADISVAEDQEFEREIAREAMQNLFGVELPDNELDGNSMEEIMAAGMARLQQQAERDELKSEQARQARAGNKKAGKAQQRAAEKAAASEQVAQAVSQSLREIYRKLVSALHPDRAVDEADRARRHEYMQRVNHAYEKSDLLTLLNVQLEIEQIDVEHLAQVPKARLGHYNKVLRGQVSELERELATTTDRYGMLEDDFGFGVTPQAVERDLLDTIAGTSEVLQTLREHRDILLQPARRKHWLKEYAKARRQEERMEAALFEDLADAAFIDFSDAMFESIFPPPEDNSPRKRGRKRRR